MGDDVLRLLVICTANQCRSPMAEVMARSLLRDRGIAAEIGSAGTDALDGIKATDGAAITVRKLGLDLSHHRSRTVTAELVESADLVLAMERRHVIDLVTTFRAQLGCTYTLPEFAQVTQTAPRTPVESPGQWLARLARQRTPAAGLAAPEIADPIGRPMRYYRRTGREISESLAQIVAAYEGVGHRGSSSPST